MLSYHESRLNGTIIPESKITRFDIQNTINEVKRRVKTVNSSNDFIIALSHVNSLFPAHKHSLMNVFQEIEISDTKFNFEMYLAGGIENLCLTFVNCRFSKITKASEYPCKFVNCVIVEFDVAAPKSNIHFEKGCNISIFTFGPSHWGSVIGIYDGTIGVISSNIQKISQLSIVRTVVGEMSLPKVELSHAEFIGVTFEKAPSFEGSSFEKTVFFDNCKFLEFDRYAEVFYREIRSILQQNHDDITASFFFSHELICRHTRIDKKISPSDWITSSSYRFINNFGLDTYKPLKIIFAQGGVAFFVFLLIAKLNLLYIQPDKVQIGTYGQAIFLSFWSTVGPLRLFTKFDELNPNQLTGEMVFWLFTVTSSIFWFFLLLGIRKKFKLTGS